MNRLFRRSPIEAHGFRGALCFFVLLLSMFNISYSFQINTLDSALRSEYPEVYPPGSDPGFTRNKVFFKLNGDDPDQIRLSLDSSRNELRFDPKLLEALEGLILPELYETVKSKQNQEGVPLSALIDIGLPVQLGRHALLMIPVPEDKKHPNQRAPRTKENVPSVLAKESEELNKKLAAEWAKAKEPVAQVDSAAWKGATANPIELSASSRQDAESNALRLHIDGTPIGETVLVWNKDSLEFEFRSPKLAETFTNIVPDDEKEKVKDKEGWFNSKALENAGISVQFDKPTQTLSLLSPTSWKKPLSEEPPQIAPYDTVPLDYSQLSKDELFSLIFKKAPPPRMREFTARLFLEKSELEQVKVMWDAPFSKYTFFSSKLKQYLDTSLTPEIRKQVNGIDGTFHSERLISGGFNIELDEAEYVLAISIPGHLKRIQNHNISNTNRDYFEGIKVQPATVSAYLNTNFYQDFSYSERFFSDDSAKARYEAYNGDIRPERRPFFADLDGAIRYKGWVLQSTGNVYEPPRGSWNRNSVVRKETQLIHDYENINSRLTLIDVSPNFPGATWSAPIVGGARFDYGKALGIDPIQENNQISFNLSSAAKVDVMVNGRLQKTMHLSSGSHRIEGIQGHPGQNIIELQVTYEDGYVQSIPYEYYQAASNNLAKGESQFKATTGINRTILEVQPHYHTSGLENRIGTGIYHYGISNTITGALFSGATSDLQVTGVRLLYTPDSSKQWNLSQSFSNYLGNRRGLYSTLTFQKKIGQVTTRTYGSWTQRSFYSNFFTSLYQPPKTQYSVGFNVSSRIWKGSGNAYTNVNINHYDSLYAPVDYTMGIGYSIQAFKGFNFNANANVTVAQQILNPTLTLTASYFFHRGNHSAYVLNNLQNRRTFIPPSMKVHRIEIDSSLSYDTVHFYAGSYENQWKNNLNTGWSWSDKMGVVGGQSISANSSFESLKSYSARLGYQHTANYGYISGSYSISDQRDNLIMARSHYLVCRMSTSFMFADGLFGIGRPVNQGFVLANGQFDLNDANVRINPSEQYGSEYSHSTGFLAANYGEFSSYNTEFIQIKMANAPYGTILDNNRFTFDNSYKQGFALRVGKHPRVLIRARIIDESNQPIGYTTFQVFETDKSSTTPIHQSFTNKNGILQVADLIPGKTYTIRFGENAFIKNFTFKVPANARGIYDFGDVKIEHEVLSSKLAAFAPKAAISE